MTEIRFEADETQALKGRMSGEGWHSSRVPTEVRCSVVKTLSGIKYGDGGGRQTPPCL